MVKYRFLDTFLRSILTVTTVWNTVETGNIYSAGPGLELQAQKLVQVMVLKPGFVKILTCVNTKKIIAL